VRSGQIRVPSSLFHEHKAVAAAWDPAAAKSPREKNR